MPLSICVFCGSGKIYESRFVDAAGSLAAICKSLDCKIIYGGAGIGLMGLIADAAIEQGVEVTGIIPRFLQTKEIAHGGLHNLEIVESMHERKQRMLDLSDLFIIMPGGFGTLDEMFEMLTWSQLQLHNKPILLWNIDGFYKHVIEHLKFLVQNQYIPNTDFNRLIICENFNEVSSFVKQYSEKK